MSIVSHHDRAKPKHRRKHTTVQVPSVPQPKSNPAMLIPAYVVWLVEVGATDALLAPVAWAAALLATAEDAATETDDVWTAAGAEVGTEPE